MARPAAPAPAAALPGDVRLMNASAALFAAVGALALAAAGLLALARQPLFALESIRVEGEVTRNSLQTIRANAMPRLAGNYLTMDLGAAKAAFESVPWVRRAVVQRVFPNRLVVRLEEHQPAARWGDEDGDRLVNTYGEVFQANPGDVEDEALPVLRGPEGTAARMLALHARLAQAFAPLAPRLPQLELTPRGAWRAKLDGGTVVEIGRAAGDDEIGELVARTRRFVATAPEVARRFRSEALYADLRHRDGYALRLRNVGTLAPGEKGPVN